MKRLFILLTIVLSVSICYAQEHLTFKGIPITGSVESFCKQLKAKGFTITTGVDDDLVGIQGKFVDQTVDGLVKYYDNNVYAVLAVMIESTDWQPLADAYDGYKDMYISKYGEPTACEETNKCKYSLDSDLSFMSALNDGLLSYNARWRVPEGVISIEIMKSGTYKGAVLIVYCDAQGVVTSMQKTIDDI
jgi:hypothetical protein